MTDPIDALSDDDLRILADELRANRLRLPITAVNLGRHVSQAVAQHLAEHFGVLFGRGFSPDSLAIMLDAVARARNTRPRIEEVIDLVTTGPAQGSVTNRDTSVVVRELFSAAEHSVVVVGYAVFQGRQVFAALANRMTERPDLKVRMFLDVQRGARDTTKPEALLAGFASRFVREQWPEKGRLPELFYYPRSIQLDGGPKASLHAKCVVVDREALFVSSANFTEAAQERNIEVGVLLRWPPMAERLAQHFDALADAGLLRPVPLPTNR